MLEDDDEWIIAYHGTGRHCRTKQEIFDMVKKNAIKACDCPEAKDYWVVNGSVNEIRPLEVLYEAVNY